MIFLVQQAIDERLQGLSVSVYDHVPQDEPYAFVVIGDAENTANDTDTELGFNGLLTINTYSSEDTERGFEEISSIMLEIYSLLHRYDLAVTGYGVSTLQQETSNLLRDNDGITRQGVQQFRIIYEQLGA